MSTFHLNTRSTSMRMQCHYLSEPEQQRIHRDSLKILDEVGDAKDYFSDIAAVGPGGHFLMEANTVAACRSREFCQPLLMERNPYEQLLKLGQPDMYANARKKVAEMLAAPFKNPLPDHIIGKLEDIMKRADEEMG